jgi:Ca2+-binding EF-hand superfamily protein
VFVDLFSEWDTDKDGLLSEADIHAGMKKLDPSLTDTQVNILVTVQNLKFDGLINLDYFVSKMMAPR